MLLLLSHFSCVQLYATRRGQPTRLPLPGTLRARTLEWVSISFSNAWKWKVKVKSLSPVWLLATPWTAAHQAPPSLGFSRPRTLEWGAIAFSACYSWWRINFLQCENTPFSLILYYFPPYAMLCLLKESCLPSLDVSLSHSQIHSYLEYFSSVCILKISTLAFVFRQLSLALFSPW